MIGSDSQNRTIRNRTGKKGIQNTKPEQDREKTAEQDRQNWTGKLDRNWTGTGQAGQDWQNRAARIRLSGQGCH
jgi:hypothetical protein